MSGREEKPDLTPVEWPLNLTRPLSLQDEIKRFVRSEMSMRAAEHGFESFEESDDFDVDDEDGNLASPYELTEMQEEAGFEAPIDVKAPPAAPAPASAPNPPPAKPVAAQQSEAAPPAVSASTSTLT